MTLTDRMNLAVRENHRATEALVIEILAEQSGVPADQIKPESKLRNDLGVDSLDEVEITLALEEEFGIDISEDQTSTLAQGTVAEMVRFVCDQ